MSWRGPDALESRLSKLPPANQGGVVGLMGGVVATVCLRGAKTDGESKLYRAIVAGLDAHVITHIAGSFVMRDHTAGVATAIPVMLPGAITARRELKSRGKRLGFRDTLNGLVFLLPAAAVCQVAARRICR